MKHKPNEYRAQSTKIFSLSVEIKAVNQNITEMKSTVRSLHGKARAKKLNAGAELEGNLNDQKELLKDARKKHGVAVTEL